MRWSRGVAVASVLVGLGLIVGVLLRAGSPAFPGVWDDAQTGFGAALTALGLAGVVAVSAARRRMLGRALLGLGAAGVLAFLGARAALAAALAGGSSAAYVALTSSTPPFDWSGAAMFVLLPALGLGGAALVLCATAGGAALGVGRLRRRAQRDA